VRARQQQLHAANYSGQPVPVDTAGGCQCIMPTFYSQSGRKPLVMGNGTGSSHTPGAPAAGLEARPWLLLGGRSCAYIHATAFGLGGWGGLSSLDLVRDIYARPLPSPLSAHREAGARAAPTSGRPRPRPPPPPAAREPPTPTPCVRPKGMRLCSVFLGPLPCVRRLQVAKGSVRAYSVLGSTAHVGQAALRGGDRSLVLAVMCGEPATY
jgi:hypothetical protein